MIRLANPADADAVCHVYNPYVLETTISFEEAPVAAAEMAARIADLCHTHPWYVYEDSGAVIGFAYAGPWRTRIAYRDAVESAVYVESPLAQGCPLPGGGWKFQRRIDVGYWELLL